MNMNEDKEYDRPETCRFVDHRSGGFKEKIVDGE
jgi:hypothetical protein